MYLYKYTYSAQFVYNLRKALTMRRMHLPISTCCRLVILLAFYMGLGQTTTYLSYSTKLGTSSISPYKFNWSVSTDQKSLMFDVCVSLERSGLVAVLFGVGFGPRDGEPVDAEIYATEFQSGPRFGPTKARFLEGYTDHGGTFHERAPGELHSARQFRSYVDGDGTVCFHFAREATSCTKNGYTIDGQTTRVFLFHDYRSPQNEPRSGVVYHLSRLWARWILNRRQATDLVAPLSLNLKNVPFQMTHLQLIKSPQEQKQASLEGAKQFEMRVHNVLIPTEDTTYWCKTDNLPQFDRKHHIIRYEPVIAPSSEDLVHHMHVFVCVGSAPTRPYNAPCNSETKPMGLTHCRGVIGAWAVGATGLTFPEETGLAIGGPESPSHVVIEIHYNNPHRIAGRVDSSGIRFYVTDRLRPYDAGLMELGLTYSARSAIPPRQHEFELRGYCDSQCTQLSFPPEGIVVFASQLHTHQTGIKVATYHMRGNRRLKDLHRDDHYSPHFQEIRLTDELIRVKPGDALITKCTHDTTDVDHVVFGGLSKLDEMCLNYIFYYPKTDLELCKSEVSQPELDDFLNRLAKKQAIKPEASTLENKFEDIEWNSDAVAELTKFYEQTTVELHCNSSDGARIEGSPVHVKPIRVPYEERIDKIWDKLKCLISNL